MKEGRPIGYKMSEESKRKIGLKNSGRKFSDEYKKKLSEARKGDKSNFWKGGISSNINLSRGSLEHRIWHKAVFERDKYTCVLCGYKSNGGKPADIHADHIKSFTHYPELRFDINNGRTLCKKCHYSTENWGGKGRRKSYVQLIPSVQWLLLQSLGYYQNTSYDA